MHARNARRVPAREVLVEDRRRVEHLRGKPTYERHTACMAALHTKAAPLLSLKDVRYDGAAA